MPRRHEHRDEDEDERLDRQLLELLNELRVVIPGVQVLFGFLLAVPFQERFGDTTPFQRNVFLVTIIASGVATALLLSLPAYHRIMFRQHDKPALIEFGNVTGLLGLGAVAVAMTGALLLVVDLWFGAATVVVSVGGLALLFAGLWFGYPLNRRIREKSSW